MENSTRIRLLNSENFSKVDDTSWHNITIFVSVQDLKSLIGDPQYDYNDGSDKVNFEWNIEFDGNYFTIYDWKEYREIGEKEKIEFHIGGFNRNQEYALRSYLASKIKI